MNEPIDRTRHLLSVQDLGAEGIDELLHLADAFSEVSERAIPKVPALRGKTVATLFFEASTRTRLSFDSAAKRLSADVLTFSPSTSSLGKGESLRDTVETIDAMGVHAMIVRHSSAGVPDRVTQWTTASVVNAGDGWHEHPTQALLDCYTIREAFERTGRRPGRTFEGMRIAIVGDVKHSRVARSDVLAFSALGAEVVLVGPATLMPPSLEGWPATVSHDLDAELGDLDVVYTLRIQQERLKEALLPSLREYTACYGVTSTRARRLRKGAVVMHPGPMNRGVEIGAEVADSHISLVTRQVRHGVATRMAVLFRLLAGSEALRTVQTVVEPEIVEPAASHTVAPDTGASETVAAETVVSETVASETAEREVENV
jgi:aspartate carbamoyltransferase catalytic subunit